MLRHSHLSTVYTGSMTPFTQENERKRIQKENISENVSEFANKDGHWRFHERWRIISDSKLTLLSCLITDFLKDDLRALWTQQAQLAWQILSSRTPLLNQQNKIRLLKQITERKCSSELCSLNYLFLFLNDTLRWVGTDTPYHHYFWYFWDHLLILAGSRNNFVATKQRKTISLHIAFIFH